MHKRPENPQAIAHLALLGNFALTLPDGSALPVVTKKNRAILAFLALSQGQQATRERLAELLWGDRAEEQARSSLRQSLAVLRKELGQADAVLQTRDDLVALGVGTLAVDAVDFLKLTESDTIESLRRAAALWRGELLSDLAIRSSSFDDWLAQERRRVGDRAIQVLERLSALERGEARIETAKRLVDLDSLREASHRALMHAYLEAGENGLALKQYETCCRLLRDELGAEPAKATQDLRDRIGEAAAAAPSAPPGPATDMRPSVAVLPFLDLGAKDGQQYFCDGMTEDIITGLSHFRHLRVISRNASFRYRGGDADPKAVARELGVHYIVEGSVRILGERIRVTVQLIDAATASHVWAETYDRRGEELFDMQAELLRTMVTTLGGRVTAASAGNALRKPPSSLAAYELVLRANALSWEKTESRIEVPQLLKQALKIDPTYARAHALLAAFTATGVLIRGMPDRGELDLALAHAKRAVELDENDSACFSILGYLRLYRSELDLANALVDRALELNPQNAYAMINKATLTRLQGNPDEALAWVRRVRRADPYFNPNWCREEEVITLFTAGRYEAALEAAAFLTTRIFLLHAIEAACHACLGHVAAAQESLRQGFALRPDLTVSAISSLLPYRKGMDSDHLQQALRLAGLPD